MVDEQVRNEQTVIPNSKCAVQHYTVAEIAAAWRLSESTIRKLFRDEPTLLNEASPTRQDYAADF